MTYDSGLSWVSCNWSPFNQMAFIPGWAIFEFTRISPLSSSLGVTRLATDEAYFGKF